MTEFVKNSMNMTASIQIDDQLTWGELFAFTDLARKAGIDPANPVLLDYDDQYGTFEGMSVFLAPEDLNAKEQST